MNYKEVAQWKEPSKLENNGEFNLKPGWLKIYYKDGKIQKEYTSEYNKRNVTNGLDVNNNIKIHLKTYKERYDSSWGEGEYERIYGSNYQQQQKDDLTIFKQQCEVTNETHTCTHTCAGIP